jgi:hypothetical protein
MVIQGGKTSATNVAGEQRLSWGDRLLQRAVVELVESRQHACDGRQKIVR